MTHHHTTLPSQFKASNVGSKAPWTTQRESKTTDRLAAMTPASRKLKAGTLARAFLGTAANPAELWRAAKLHLTRKACRHASDDAQLALYARVLPTGFLHFGYFDDPDQRPGEHEPFAD